MPVAVGRTALAVGGLADSALVLRLTRSRLWIGVLGTLLVGIVALNVFALSLNASSSKTAALADELRRENSALGADVADVLSNERLQSAAIRLGLIWPEPGAILYLDARHGNAEAAAARLRRGQITIGSEYVAPVAPVVPVEEAVVAPEVEETTAPEEVAPVAPTETAPTTTTTPTATGAAPTAGGISAAP